MWISIIGLGYVQGDIVALGCIIGHRLGLPTVPLLFVWNKVNPMTKLPDLPLAAPLLDGTGRWLAGFAPFTFSSIGIDDIELGPSVGVVLGVLFAASRLKMTGLNIEFLPRLTFETHPTGHFSPLKRPFACGSVSLALATSRAAS